MIGAPLRHVHPGPPFCDDHEVPVSFEGLDHRLILVGHFFIKLGLAIAVGLRQEIARRGGGEVGVLRSTPASSDRAARMAGLPVSRLVFHVPSLALAQRTAAVPPRVAQQPLPGLPLNLPLSASSHRRSIAARAPVRPTSRIHAPPPASIKLPDIVLASFQSLPRRGRYASSRPAATESVYFFPSSISTLDCHEAVVLFPHHLALAVLGDQ